jgi:hypothetical protein
LPYTDFAICYGALRVSRFLDLLPLTCTIVKESASPDRTVFSYHEGTIERARGAPFWVCFSKCGSFALFFFACPIPAQNARAFSSHFENGGAGIIRGGCPIINHMKLLSRYLFTLLGATCVGFTCGAFDSAFVLVGRGPFTPTMNGGFFFPHFQFSNFFAL